MKKVNVINNFDEQIKSLNDNNIPYKYYNPSHNINIRNYLSSNDIKYKCKPNSYLSLNELVEFVDNLNNSKNDNINYIINDYDNSNIEIIDGKVNSNEKYIKENSENYEGFNNKNLINENNTLKLVNDTYNCHTNYTKNSNVIYTLSNEISNSSENKNIIHNKINIQTSSISNINNDNNLLKDLLKCRSTLSKKNNIKDPEKLISTKNLKLMLLHRPKSIDDIRNLNLTGFGEDKIKKYGYDFLKVFLSNY
ncbi:conserved Plasmodium protein, unknown function [Plasmodium gallinaceum]|uniref:HRDC domain-containing protein n=1 Tax=Plasmodium gallinaceum TaxID=5849 RepID=A0A1J1GT75_PLAGA|nr:conserved Plasmodium protein, unknown function [Plasmodium gallinaceum]CRG95690.1 conserved Plasmodium protein, unknown function [Plasmodium gallinaceum]